MLRKDSLLAVHGPLDVGRREEGATRSRSLTSSGTGTKASGRRPQTDPRIRRLHN